MRQLARTLLILGGMTACERAHPVVDDKERPAVGNIGQTGKPQRPAAAVPLIDTKAAPAVGNIGQTGAPPHVIDQQPKHRVERVKRAARRPAIEVAIASLQRQPAGAVVPALDQQIQAEQTVAIEIERPIVSSREEPMVGNTMMKCGGPDCGQPRRSANLKREQLAFQRAERITGSLSRWEAERAQRPAVGNTMSKHTPSKRGPTARQRLARLTIEVGDAALELMDERSDRSLRLATLEELLSQYEALKKSIADGAD